MKTRVYKSLQRKITAITLVVSITPLMLLGATIYYSFARMYKEKIEEQMRYRARSQAEAVDLFLKERTAILAVIADTQSFEDLVKEENLSRLFDVMNLRAGAFMDLGVIDSSGMHRAYVGPYNLMGLNYYNQPWFAEAMGKGVYISDVFMGYRRIPHFIIAVRHHERQEGWILRATIDPDIFGSMVRGARLGKTGDAYIISREGFYQTRPRFNGEILWESKLDTSVFGGETTVVERTNGLGRKLLYAGSWLRHKRWLLVISQDTGEEMKALLSTRNIEVIIVLVGLIAIIAMTIFTTRLTVGRLKQADARMNELNAQLVQSDKMAALGKMAAGVAHEINNPLAVIIQKTGWMEDLLLEEDLERSKNIEEFRTSLRKIEEHVERARKVVHNMLGYARKMEPRMEAVDVNATVMQTIALLDNYARINNIAIRTDMESDLPVVASDQSQLQQVFLNLVTNAIDAIGDNGTIEVLTTKTDHFILAHIKDDGPGISPEDQKRVFDPFFTTKHDGKGVGLGLWVSYNIMEKMGGNITVSSERGKGSHFTVKIPIIFPEKK